MRQIHLVLAAFLIAAIGAKAQRIEVVDTDGNGIHLVNVLTELKSRYPDIYQSVSQVDVAEYGKIDVHYIISYSGINKKTYLKNQINVDLVREGLVTALFLQGTDSQVNTAFYSGIGFVY